ncbi:MAG TPA: amino acid permease [Alphaproteobacteria bacterium]
MPDPGPAPPAPELKRGLNLALLTLYGLGTTIGAGIYVLVGEVAAVAGALAPASFLIAACLAATTGLSFGELGARYPKSAGEAVYVDAGFGLAWLAALVGLMVAGAGVISSAAIANGFVGYARQFVDAPPWALMSAMVAALAAAAVWGIVESVLMAALVTVIEIAGLVLVVVVGLASIDVGEAAAAAAAGLDASLVPGAFAGAVLAFYAFLGFEDMVNVAEEVQAPERTLPRAIVLTLAVTGVLYVAVAVAAVLVVPRADLAGAEAPLALVWQHATGREPALISAIGALAVVNGALIQIIMAARVVYGLASQGWLPAVLGRVQPRTRTPALATLVVASLVLALALALPLVRLAEATAFVILIVFALVNLALLRVKRRAPLPPGARAVPRAVPAAGFAVSAGVALFQAWRYVA